METKSNLNQITKTLDKLFSAGFNTEKKILTTLLPIKPAIMKLSNLSKHFKTKLAPFLPSSAKTLSLILFA